jgi:hypothetical protein
MARAVPAYNVGVAKNAQNTFNLNIAIMLILLASKKR